MLQGMYLINIDASGYGKLLNKSLELQVGELTHLGHCLTLRARYSVILLFCRTSQTVGGLYCSEHLKVV